MRSGIVVDLVQAHYSHSEEDFRRIVDNLIDDEFAKGNRSLAVSIQRAMVPRNRSAQGMTPIAQQDGDDLFHPSLPEAALDDVALTPAVHDAISRIIAEHSHIGELESRGIYPTSRILLRGPPGCGKTMVAHAIADSLGRRIMVVDFGTLISSLMGESGSNIGRMFAKAASTGSVLFIDEIDAIGRTRDDDSDNGEAKRIVISLLQNLDRAPGDLMVIAATNMFDSLDGALVRRFQMIVGIDMPTAGQRADIVRRYFERHPHDGGYDPVSLDGFSRAMLYETKRDGEIQSWYLSGQTLDAIPQHWVWPSDGATYDDTAFIGAATAWVVWRKAMVQASGTEQSATEGYVRELGETRRKFGFLLWNTVNRGYYRYTLQNPGYVIEEMEGKEVLHLSSTPQMIFPGGAMKLEAKFSAFYGYGDATEPGTGAIGPITVRRSGRITDWELSLRVDDYYYNGTSWQQDACTFTVDLVSSGEDDTTAEYAELKPTERAADAKKYEDGEEGFIIPMQDAEGRELTLNGRVELTFYFRASADPDNTAGRFSPIMIYDVSLEHLRPAGEDDPYSEEGETDGAHHYLMATGGRFADDVREAELELGTWNGDRAAYNLLFDAQGEPVTSVTSWRQLGHRDRPERLVCRNMARLYGRAARQLTVEVDASALDPRAALTGSDGRRYALAGVEWDVRDDTCRYTLEDYTPWDEWTMDS